MEFLRPLLAKIELICQQLAMPQLSGVEGVASQPWGAGQDGWAHGVVWLCGWGCECQPGRLVWCRRFLNKGSNYWNYIMMTWCPNLKGFLWCCLISSLGKCCLTHVSWQAAEWLIHKMYGSFRYRGYNVIINCYYTTRLSKLKIIQDKVYIMESLNEN